MKVFITKKAQKELDKIPDAVARNIAKNITSLSQNPYPTNSKKLQGIGNYRIRIGTFRAIYLIDKRKKEITVLRIAHRKTIYK